MRHGDSLSIRSMRNLSMCPSSNYGGVLMRDSGCSLSFFYYIPSPNPQKRIRPTYDEIMMKLLHPESQLEKKNSALAMMKLLYVYYISN